MKDCKKVKIAVAGAGYVGLSIAVLLAQFNDVIVADKTHVQVLKEPGRKDTSDSYMWVYCSIKGTQNLIRYFEYQPGSVEARGSDPPAV